MHPPCYLCDGGNYKPHSPRQPVKVLGSSEEGRVKPAPFASPGLLVDNALKNTIAAEPDFLQEGIMRDLRAHRVSCSPPRAVLDVKLPRPVDDPQLPAPPDVLQELVPGAATRAPLRVAVVRVALSSRHSEVMYLPHDREVKLTEASMLDGVGPCALPMLVARRRCSDDSTDRETADGLLLRRRCPLPFSSRLNPHDLLKKVL